MTARLGIQLEPWHSAHDLADVASKLAGKVDIAWVPDQPLAREVFSILPIIANVAGISVGTSVTHAVGRDPLNIARSMATIREATPPSLEVVMGLGAGGPMPISIYGRNRSLSRVRETITLVRSLWAGESVSLTDFPALSSAFGYAGNSSARLMFAVTQPIPIVIAGVGPKIMQLAGEMADGVINASTFPNQSIAALRSASYGAVSCLGNANDARSGDGAGFRRIFGINCSISADGARARQHAKKHAVLILANKGYRTHFESLDIDMESVRAVGEAFGRGEGVEGAQKFVSDTIVDQLVISGTPQECVPKIAEVRDLAAGVGYNEFYFGVPLGPDLNEVARLLSEVVIPQIWPERK